jgi:hypothetical protein
VKKEFDNEMRGCLFKNDKKGNPKAPDVTGPARIKGIDYRVAGWVDNSGAWRCPLRFEELKPTKVPIPNPKQPDFDDEIPF